MNRLDVSIEKKAELLDFTRWSIGLDWAEIETLVTYLHVFKAEKGQPIFREGDRRPYMVIVVKGEAEIFKQDSSGEKRALSVTKVGQALGEMSIIDGQPRSATAMAKDDTILLLLTQRSFARLMSNHPGLGVKLYERIAKLLSQRLRQASGILVDFLGQEPGDGGGNVSQRGGMWGVADVPESIREIANKDAAARGMRLGEWLSELIISYSRDGAIRDLIDMDAPMDLVELAKGINALNRRLQATEHRINGFGDDVSKSRVAFLSKIFHK